MTDQEFFDVYARYMLNPEPRVSIRLRLDMNRLAARESRADIPTALIKIAERHELNGSIVHDWLDNH